jgi:hypothetical protein
MMIAVRSLLAHSCWRKGSPPAALGGLARTGRRKYPEGGSPVTSIEAFLLPQGSTISVGPKY